jgi:rod shape determining protein RodA
MSKLRVITKLDLILLFSVLALLTLGLTILFAINFKAPSLAQDFNPTNQLVFALIGLVGMGVLARLDYKIWYRFAWWWYAFGIGLLIAVLVFGEASQGATRWINFGFFQFQPVEFIKLALIMLLARSFAKNFEKKSKIQYIVGSFLLVISPSMLIAVQPDLGSALVLFFIWGVMLVFSNVRKVYLLLGIIIFAFVSPFIYTNLEPYQKERLVSFTNPNSDPQGSGYNVAQSIIAIGSGGMFGKGLGAGSQSQLNFLPSQHTDFVFAVLSEKLGFIGGSLTLLLFLIIIYRAVLIGWRAEDKFGMLLAVGIVAMMAFHIVVNVGMNLGLLPVTGLPLPLLSYGGTHLIIILFSVGLLESIHIHHKKFEFKN